MQVHWYGISIICFVHFVCFVVIILAAIDFQVSKQRIRIHTCENLRTHKVPGKLKP
jgi:hypothetical protein